MDAQHKGFICGMAWAVAAHLRYEMEPSELLKNSGLTVEAMREAEVSDSDFVIIKSALEESA